MTRQGDVPDDIQDEPSDAQAAPRKGGRFDVKSLALLLTLPVIILVVWEVVTVNGLVSEFMLPTPQAVVAAFVDYLLDGTLANDVLTSLKIVLEGYVCGAVLGLLLGYFMGMVQAVEKFFHVVLSGLRQIPPLAWIPLFILWFGIGDLPKVVLISMGTFFQVLVNTVSGVQHVPEGYLELAQNYRIRRFDVITRIILPSALPQILVGLRLGASTAWVSIVAAEMIAATAGVGYRISVARNWMQPDVMIAYMVVIGVIGGLMDVVLRKIEKRSLRWQEGR